MATTKASQALPRATFTEAEARRLGYLAAIVAIEAPRKRGKYSSAAYVRWSLIEEIRASLTAAGFDVDQALRLAHGTDPAAANRAAELET